MILLQALVGFRDDAVAELGKLLTDDDVEGELLELADTRETKLAGSQDRSPAKIGIYGTADDVGRPTVTRIGDRDETAEPVSRHAQRDDLRTVGQASLLAERLVELESAMPLIEESATLRKNSRGQEGRRKQR
jgi:hypothetical protein